jgi:hypothetical protein
MILDALKKRLYKNEQKHPGKWLKELPAKVWGLRIQPSHNTGVSPYFMVFGFEASYQLTSPSEHQESRTIMRKTLTRLAFLSLTV